LQHHQTIVTLLSDKFAIAHKNGMVKLHFLIQLDGLIPHFLINC